MLSFRPRPSPFFSPPFLFPTSTPTEFLSCTMGASKSKSVEDKAALSKVVDHPIQTSDVSTGFHILEIHMPSVGMGWMSLLLLLGGAVLIYALWCKFHGQGTARVSQHQLHQPWIGYPGPMGHPRREFDFLLLRGVSRRRTVSTTNGSTNWLSPEDKPHYSPRQPWSLVQPLLSLRP